MAKPTRKTNWTIGNSEPSVVRVEPSDAKKIEGWNVEERPAREFMNWIFHNFQEWIDYLEAQTDAFVASKLEYDAVIGIGGTHATINALMADADIANIKSVLVKDSMSLATIQVIDQPNMNFIFKAGVTVSKDTATTGIRIDAPNVRLMRARFNGFSTGGDIAIQLTSNAKNCMILESVFKDCDTEIEDNGDNNIYANNLTEIA